jgi:Lactate racemase N-terminal domain
MDTIGGTRIEFWNFLCILSELMSTIGFPRMLSVRQQYPASPPLDIRETIQEGFAGVGSQLKPGARIAVAVGSRGISNLQIIVATVLDLLKEAGAQPFIVPAMGSHGGATSEGQTQLLAEYGITEEHLKVPIKAAMDVERIAKTEDGVDVFFSAEGLRSDGIVAVNRVKPHTDFSSDSLGSGVLKMLVVGLGKRTGAAAFHAAAARLGYEHVLRSISRVTLRTAPILAGVVIVENQFHETARVAVLTADDIERGEAELFAEAKRLMPKLPFGDIDLLIVDRIGKNISGAGMDPNITGRWVHGDSTMAGGDPAVRRLLVRDLTPESHGNAIGIGLADLTTGRLVRAMNKEFTYINALTSLTPECAKIPIHFETDREAIWQALLTLALPDSRQAKVVRIADTLSLEQVEISEAYSDLLKQRDDLSTVSAPAEMNFDATDNLLPLRR